MHQEVKGQDAHALVAQGLEQGRIQANGGLELCLGRLVLDLTSVAYVDSVGLECLMDAAEQTGRAGECLRVCGVSDTMREVFELTEMAPFFEDLDGRPDEGMAPLAEIFHLA